MNTFKNIVVFIMTMLILFGCFVIVATALSFGELLLLN
jgi:hypothetical protein